jgi:hypothetical protein
MQEFNTREKFAAEHHRLHSVEQWPDGIRKEALVRAIESTIESLSRHPGGDGGFSCIVCENRRMNLKVLEPRDLSRVRPTSESVGAWELTG